MRSGGQEVPGRLGLYKIREEPMSYKTLATISVRESEDQEWRPFHQGLHEFKWADKDRTNGQLELSPPLQIKAGSQYLVEARVGDRRLTSRFATNLDGVLTVLAFQWSGKPSCGDENVERLISEHRKRSEDGQRKYNNTTDREDLQAIHWAQHAKEEAMDLAVYLNRFQHQLRIDADEQKLLRVFFGTLRAREWLQTQDTSVRPSNWARRWNDLSLGLDAARADLERFYTKNPDRDPVKTCPWIELGRAAATPIGAGA